LTSYDDQDAARAAEVLDAKVSWRGDHFRFSFASPRGETHVAVYPPRPDRPTFVVAYAREGHLQLHGVSGYVLGENEVTFFAAQGDRVSGLVAERGGGVALYANVPRSYISADFSAIGVEATLAGLALSAAEDELEGGG
jgi:hypothetical protein